MSTLNLLHWWNARICPPIGLICNILLIFLVIKRTPSEMRIHSRILLQTGIFDIIILTLNILGQPVGTNNANVTIILFDGYLSFLFENDSNMISILCYSTYAIALIDIFGVTPQFIYRYLVLNRGFKINFSKYFGILSVIFLPLSIYFANNCVQILNATRKMPFNESGIFYNDEMIRSHFDENEMTKYFVRNTKNVPTDLFNFGFVIFSLISYMAIAFCGWKMCRFVNSNLTGRKKELSKQLNRNLAMLAILPIIYFMIMTVSMLLLIANGIGNPEELITIKIWQLHISLTFHWMPVLNPLISIVTNMPYRKAIMKMANQIVPSKTQIIHQGQARIFVMNHN